MAEKLSNQLKEKLGEQESTFVEDLFDFKEELEDLSSYSTCSPEQVENIVNKELNITDFVEQIIKIKNGHSSNEEKKVKIKELLNADISDLLSQLEDEIEKVKEHLDEKGKEIAEGIKEKAIEMRDNFDRLIDGNIETEEEEIVQASQRREKIFKDEKEKAVEETHMVVREGTGFMANFRKMREQGHGFFKSVFGAMKLTREDVKVPEVQPTQNEEVAKLEEELKSVEEEIKTSKNNIKKLKEQKKELQDKIVEAAGKAMEETKAKVKKSKEPIPEAEITEERVGGLREKIQGFFERRREAMHEKKVEKLNSKIEAKTEKLKGLADERDQYRAEREKDEGERRTDKQISQDLGIILNETTKTQKERYELARKVQKENERYERRSHRNEGQDR